MNFVPLLNEIVASGLSQAEVARKLGIGQSTVNEACNADKWEPRYSLGKRVLELHKAVQRKQKRTAVAA